MSQKRIKKPKLSKRKHDIYSSVSIASKGLYGDPLGFGQFMRSLPDQTLSAAHDDMSLCFLIALRAKLIVLGDPNKGVPKEDFSDVALYAIRRLLILEHLRRMTMLRVRYPRDPFTEIPQSAWWRAHPFVELLEDLSVEQRRKLQDVILETGDMTVLSGHVLLLSEERQTEFDRKMQLIEKNRLDLLRGIDEDTLDPTTLAWTGDDMSQILVERVH